MTVYLNKAIDDKIFKESLNPTALYYGEIENILTKEELKELQKLTKYKDHIYEVNGKDIVKTAESAMKNTNLKRGICKSLLSEADNMINFKIPYINNTENDDYITYNYKITNSQYFDTNNDKLSDKNKKTLYTDCRSFYSYYCENLRKRIKKDGNNSLLVGEYNNECGCYDDDIIDKSEKKPEIYKDFKNIEASQNNRSCQLKNCKGKFNYSPTNFNTEQACSNLTICQNNVDFKNITIEDSELQFITNMSNNCGSDSNLKRSLDNYLKDEPEEPTPEPSPEPEEPEEPEPIKPEPKPIEPIEPVEPEKPEEPTPPPTPEPIEPEEPEKPEEKKKEKQEESKIKKEKEDNIRKIVYFLITIIVILLILILFYFIIH